MPGRTLRRRRSQNFNDKGPNREDSEYAVHAMLSNSDSERYVRLGRSVFQLYAPRRDPPWVTILEVVGLLTALALMYYSYYYFDHLHFHVSHGYAHLGYPSAQHVVGQRYLVGKGTEKNDTMAMKWFRAAADQGHPEASFNLAVGHMHGSKTELRKGESERLLRFAADKGVEAAHHALNLCARRGCD